MRAATALDRAYRALILGDAALGTAAWVIAWGIRRSLDTALARPVSSLTNHLALLPMLVPLWLVANASRGLYGRPTALGRFREFQLLLQSATAVLVASMMLSFVFKELEIARMVVFLAAAVTLLLVTVERSLVRSWAIRTARALAPD